MAKAKKGRALITGPAGSKPGRQGGEREAEKPKVKTPQLTSAPTTGRNEPCPCGSGKKHKRCCGA